MVGWANTAGAMLWAFIILGAAYFLTRHNRQIDEPGIGSRQAFIQTVGYLSTRPLQFGALILLSLLAYGLLDVIAYFIAAAYSNEYVILHFPYQALTLALVAGYTASFIQITPGGMGQFEWGFAAGLYLAGAGQPEAMVMAILYQTFRMLVSGVALLSVGTLFGVETSVRRVMNIFRGESLQPANLPAS
jgi:uncharacterized membrane protein YbhN (UPF0104 family)